jgi:hypothetical protein
MLGRSGVGFPLVLLAVASVALLPGCSTVERLGGTKKEGVRTDSAARYVTPDDPMARPIQVAWTSARASTCGFMFDPAKLKDDFMRDESRTVTDPYQLQRISQAYDYTLTSVADTIKSDPKYCTRERTDAIRADLRRYLAGDYSPTAKLAR